MTEGTRRTLAISAIAVGLGLCLAALLFNSDIGGWAANVAIEIGATVFLVVPLLYLTKMLEGKIRKVEQKATEDIQALTGQVAEAREEIRRTKEELSNAVTTELHRARMGDVEIFEKIAIEPTKQEVADALRRADQLGLITPEGCRVGIFDTDYYLSFRPIDEMWGYFPSTPLRAHLESKSGKQLSRIDWTDDVSALQFLVQVGEALQAIGQSPGGIAFDSAKIFTDLSELLVVTHRHATGPAGIHNPLGRVYQFCSPQWVITRNSVSKIGELDTSYNIPLSVLNEADWFDHIQRKAGVDTSSLSAALEDALALWTAQVLVPDDSYADISKADRSAGLR